MATQRRKPSKAATKAAANLDAARAELAAFMASRGKLTGKKGAAIVAAFVEASRVYSEHLDKKSGD